MKLFQTDLRVYATVHVKADTELEALQIVRDKVAGACIHAPFDFDDRPFNLILEDEDPVANITYSPAMTVAPWDQQTETVEIGEAGA